MARVWRTILGLVIVAVTVLGVAPRAEAAGVYGTIYLYDFENDEVKPVESLYRIEARLDRQRVKTISKPDGTYRMHVGRRGVGEISLTHRGRKLTAEFDSRDYDRKFDLYIQYQGDQYRLVARAMRIRPPRRSTPE